MKTRHSFLSLFLLLLLMVLAGAPAVAQIPAAEREILEDFYLAANGDDWLRNDGWLDEGTDVCEWYGVECRFRGDDQRDVVVRVELPQNNLGGHLDTRIFEIVHENIDLSGNRIDGTLDRLPASPGQVDLSDNRMSGGLPSEVGLKAAGWPPSRIWYLDLSGNDFSGEVPSDWPRISWLSLADNLLEGMPEVLFDPASNPHFLNLAGNQFSGALPASIQDANFLPHDGASRWGGGLNLCWNDWLIPESVQFDDWLRDHHVGGASFEQCLGKARMPVDSSLSGSWFDPERAGEGLVLQTLDDDRVLLFWFTFGETGGQRWLFEVGAARDRLLYWSELVQTRGHFDQGLDQEHEDGPMEVRGSMRLDRIAENQLLAERVYIDQTALPCLAVYPPSLGCFGSSLSDRLNHIRLTEVAGTTCNNQAGSTLAGTSGAWYNPERAGEGFIVEALPDGTGVVYWFTHKPDGSGEQAWMIGVGEFEFSAIITPPPDLPAVWLDIDAVYQPVGAQFGSQFDPGEVEMVDWGSLSIEFYRHPAGRVIWDSNFEEYGSGEYPIEPLARPMLAECEE